jgi:hypothetical protein
MEIESLSLRCLKTSSYNYLIFWLFRSVGVKSSNKNSNKLRRL